MEVFLVLLLVLLGSQFLVERKMRKQYEKMIDWSLREKP